MDLPVEQPQPEVKTPSKAINLKILFGIIIVVVIAAIILIGFLTLKRSTNLTSQPVAKPQITPVITKTSSSTPSAHPQIGTPEGSASASKISSDTIPVAQRSYAKFIDGTIVSFNASTNILTLSTKDTPALQITIDSSVKLYKDTGMANIVPIQASGLTTGSTVSVQEDTNGKIIQITVAFKP